MKSFILNTAFVWIKISRLCPMKNEPALACPVTRAARSQLESPTICTQNAMNKLSRANTSAHCSRKG